MKGRRSSALSSAYDPGGTGYPSAPEVDRSALLKRAKQIFELRRQRAQRFGKAMFGEPAWDMLLALYIGERHGETQTIAQLTRFSGLSASLAQRWLDYLLGQELVYLEADAGHSDRISLAGRAREELESYLGQAILE